MKAHGTILTGDALTMLRTLPDQPLQSLTPLPMQGAGRKTPGLGRLVSRALRGEAAARNAVEKLIRQTCAGVRQ